MEQDLGITPTLELSEAAAASILILAVKPFVFPKLLEDLKAQLNEQQLVVSIAAGVTIAQMEEVLGQRKIVRVMPNTPALVGEGMTSISNNPHVTVEEAAEIQKLFESMGKAAQVPESMIDAVIGPAVLPQHIPICSLKHWPMAQSPKECPAKWPMNLLLRQF